MKKKNIITILLGIIFLGAILRFYNLGNNSFVADEFLDINSSYAYSKTHHWQAWDFNWAQVDKDNVNQARDERAWIYKWQVAQFIKSVPTVARARAASAIWGVISILLMYFSATYFTKKREVGLLAAFLFAISVLGIIHDRTLRMYAMFLPVFLAFSWMLFRFLEEKYEGKNKLLKLFWEKWKVNLLYLIPALVLGAVSILVHQLTANIIFIILIYSIIRFYQNRKNIGASIYNKYFLIILVMVLGYIGALIAIPKQLLTYTNGIEFFNSHWSYFTIAFTDYSYGPLAALFMLFGAWWLWKREKLSKESLWLSVSFFGMLLIAAFIWNRTVGDQYFFFVISFGIILLASGIYGSARFFGENMTKYGKYAYAVPFILAVFLLSNWAYFFQDNNTYHQNSDADSPDFKKVFAYFKKARDPQDVLITRNFRNYYWDGAKVKVFDFGGELNKNKVSVDEIKNIEQNNPSGWLIITDNDEVYISNDAMDYVVKNWQKVSNLSVRGKVQVYRWGNNNAN